MENLEKYPKKIYLLKSKVDLLSSNPSSHKRAMKYSRKLKRTLMRFEIEKEKKIAQHKNNKRFYSFCRKRLKLCESIPSLITADGRVLKDDWVKAEEFAKYFQSTYKKPTQSSYTLPPRTRAELIGLIYLVTLFIAYSVNFQIESPRLRMTSPISS